MPVPHGSFWKGGKDTKTAYAHPYTSLFFCFMHGHAASRTARKAAFNVFGFGATFAKNWTPSLATFGASGLVAGVYFTEEWIGHNVVRYIPFVGAKYNNKA